MLKRKEYSGKNDMVAFYRQMMQFYANQSNGIQKEYYSKRADDCKKIDVVPMSEVFSKGEIKSIKNAVKPKRNQCYMNAFHLCGIDEDYKYCEGVVFVSGIPIDHAWTKVGDKYVDITLDLVIKEDVKENDYVLLGEWSYDEALKQMAKKGVYGGVYQSEFEESIK